MSELGEEEGQDCEELEEEEGEEDWVTRRGTKQERDDGQIFRFQREE